MEESNPYVSSWKGKGKNNHISQLSRHSTYRSAQPDEQLDYYYIRSPRSPPRQRNTELFQTSEENNPRSPRQSTYSNLVNSYVVKGNGNFPISTPGTGSSRKVLPHPNFTEPPYQEFTGVRPIFSGQSTPKTERGIDLGRENIYIYTSPSSGSMGGGNGQYPSYLGSNSPSTIYARSNGFAPTGRKREATLYESGYEGSFSPSSKNGLIYGGRGDDFSIGNQGAPHVTGNVSLPTKNYASLKATAQYTPPRSNWRGAGNLSGNYGIGSAGDNSSYGGSSPGFSPSSSSDLTMQNLQDSIVKPRYTL